MRGLGAPLQNCNERMQSINDEVTMAIGFDNMQPCKFDSYRQENELIHREAARSKKTASQLALGWNQLPSTTFMNEVDQLSKFFPIIVDANHRYFRLTIGNRLTFNFAASRL